MKVKIFKENVSNAELLEDKINYWLHDKEVCLINQLMNINTLIVTIFYNEKIIQGGEIKRD